MSTELSNLLKGLDDLKKKDSENSMVEDVITFIKKNWKYFCKSKVELYESLSSIGSMFDYDIEGLCVALSIPEYVVFKKIKIKDSIKALLDFESSKVKKMFDEVSKTKKYCCLIALAGEHTLVVTNLNVEYPANYRIEYYKYYDDKGNINTINIFKFKDSLSRGIKLGGS